MIRIRAKFFPMQSPLMTQAKMNYGIRRSWPMENLSEGEKEWRARL
jgi:hypothetical protein